MEIAAHKLGDNGRPIPRKPTARSAVSNGTRLLAGIDGRFAQARRFRDLIIELTAELDGAISTAQLGAIRQAAAINLRLEQLQAAIVRGEAVDTDTLIRLSSEARRILASLRNTKRQRGPALGSLGDLLRADRAEQLAASADKAADDDGAAT
jgi:hypothetical protein